jgi:hypothetical protein
MFMVLVSMLFSRHSGQIIDLLSAFGDSGNFEFLFSLIEIKLNACLMFLLEGVDLAH